MSCICVVKRILNKLKSLVNHIVSNHHDTIIFFMNTSFSNLIIKNQRWEHYEWSTTDDLADYPQLKRTGIKINKWYKKLVRKENGWYKSRANCDIYKRPQDRCNDRWSQHIIKHAVRLIIYMKYSNCRIRTLKKTLQIM
jgi:hypothetical protein